MKFRVVLEHDPVAEGWSASALNCRGVLRQVIPQPKHATNVEDAIRLYLAPSEIDLPRDARLIEVTIG